MGQLQVIISEGSGIITGTVPMLRERKRMRLFIAFFIIGCFITTGACALDLETKDRIIDVYNITATQYALIVGAFDDLSNEKITKDIAREKIDEWKTQYNNKTEPIPQEAKEMCSLMNEMIDLARDAARDYEPHNQRTKDVLKKLEEAKSDLNKEMTEVKYLLQ